jgi:hypothetical protein
MIRLEGAGLSAAQTFQLRHPVCRKLSGRRANSKMRESYMAWPQVMSAAIRNQMNTTTTGGALIRRTIICGAAQRSSLAFAKATSELTAASELTLYNEGHPVSVGVHPCRRARGLIDLEIGVIGTPAPEVPTQLLFQDEFVGVVRLGIQSWQRIVCRRSFMHLANMFVASRRGGFFGPVDDLGLERTVVATGVYVHRCDAS